MFQKETTHKSRSFSQPKNPQKGPFVRKQPQKILLQLLSEICKHVHTTQGLLSFQYAFFFKLRCEKLWDFF